MEYFLEFFPDLNTQVFTTKVGENVITYKTSGNQDSYFLYNIRAVFKRHQIQRKHTGDFRDLISDLYANFRGASLWICPAEPLSTKVPHDMLQIDRIGRVVSYIYKIIPTSSICRRCQGGGI